MGKIPLGVSNALIKKGDVFVGNDSGPQYFAVYSGLKTAVIYGYTVIHKRWSPKVESDKFVGFSIPVDCGPCELSMCNSVDGHICMEAISVDMVYQNIKKWL